MKWFLPGPKYFGPRRAYPAWKPATRYSVFEAWYIVTDPNEEVTYLWRQARRITKRPTMGDLLKVVPKGRRFRDMTPEELIQHLPVEVRAPKGITWAEVLKQKSQIHQEQIEKMEEHHEYEDLQVSDFVGWWAYPAVGG